jgi:hypothetical protein
MLSFKIELSTISSEIELTDGFKKDSEYLVYIFDKKTNSKDDFY